MVGGQNLGGRGKIHFILILEFLKEDKIIPRNILPLYLISIDNLNVTVIDNMKVMTGPFNTELKSNLDLKQKQCQFVVILVSRWKWESRNVGWFVTKCMLCRRFIWTISSSEDCCKYLICKWRGRCAHDDLFVGFISTYLISGSHL